ncbi:hypothetical protein BDN72DRAFT_420133 [Pluteus cervinus]|uniref:Uncharacterized protein n=1 Tax=Pluteus cervinus TaxID=181527 RepID=A0ACD3A836_9AGAR|nr:hypothetical protein BDN72DRAFT_420133 [Pluteus cervinus]
MAPKRASDSDHNKSRKRQKVATQPQLKNSKKRVTCEYCPLTFADNSVWRRHWTSIHQGIGPRCPNCMKKIYSRLDSCQRHLKTNCPHRFKPNAILRLQPNWMVLQGWTPAAAASSGATPGQSVPQGVGASSDDSDGFDDEDTSNAQAGPSNHPAALSLSRSPSLAPMISVRKDVKNLSTRSRKFDDEDVASTLDADLSAHSPAFLPEFNEFDDDELLWSTEADSVSTHATALPLSPPEVLPLPPSPSISPSIPSRLPSPEPEEGELSDSSEVVPPASPHRSSVFVRPEVAPRTPVRSRTLSDLPQGLPAESPQRFPRLSASVTPFRRTTSSQNHATPLAVPDAVAASLTSPDTLAGQLFGPAFTRVRVTPQAGTDDSPVLRSWRRHLQRNRDVDQDDIAPGIRNVPLLPQPLAVDLANEWEGDFADSDYDGFTSGSASAGTDDCV